LSTDTQGRFTAAMQKIADDQGAELVIDRSYSNIGRCSFARAGIMAPFYSFTFDFQGGYASLKGEPLEPRFGYCVTIPDGKHATLDEAVRAIREGVAIWNPGREVDSREEVGR